MAHEVDEVHSELLAVQAVLMAVLRRLAREGPELMPLFCAAFDGAETVLAGVAAREGLESAIGTTTAALDVIDQIRTAVIRDESACRS